ncbi:hypothetical protein HWC80_gp084 [Mycobacterium phage Indlulamithi]|uniref:Uncharacterized protein n=1 Tax=Mycobacterium phage Indlulamithi TaxID=2656582 RepID=A0A649VCS0_9CAUD|nr:hypothetical protein HWC80_gp084 [Mycobacterium phage Indlulamithi]QGJ90128.1 hypothetical protein PBI_INDLULAMITHI_90 [Mycobacterium phage Indlulamithi]
MAAECICAIPDSFNVRMSDLRNPRCPVHGVPIVEGDKATHDELKNLLREQMQEIQLTPGMYVFAISNADIDTCARNLLARYDIRRKR